MYCIVMNVIIQIIQIKNICEGTFDYDWNVVEYHNLRSDFPRVGSTLNKNVNLSDIHHSEIEGMSYRLFWLEYLRIKTFLGM